MSLYDPLGHSEYRAMQSARDFQIACHQAADEGAKPHPLMDGGPLMQHDCAKCSRPLVFIRDRNFPDGSGKVWMCENPQCESWQLYVYP